MLPTNPLEAWREICQAVDGNELEKIFKEWEAIEETQTSHFTNAKVKEIRTLIDEAKGFIKGREEERSLDKDYQQHLFTIKMEFISLIRAEYGIMSYDGTFKEWLELGKQQDSIIAKVLP